MNTETLINLLEQEVKGLSRYLDDNDYRNAVNDACFETGWSLPTSVDFRIFWLKNRAKRHIFFYLQTEQAYKFKFEQINLQHRFEHLTKLIGKMDSDFERAIKENVTEFADVDLNRLFGTYLTSGIKHNKYGVDISSNSDVEVEFTPDEMD